MVKNSTGGNKSKMFARKHVAKSTNYLRVAVAEGEIYAIVTKINGNNMFNCYCIDGINRLGHIRGKFSGRGKRDNEIVLGTWVLVGFREWGNNEEAPVKNTKIKLSHCDLLEVYTSLDKEKLKETVIANWNNLIDQDVTKQLIHSNMDADDDNIFMTEKDEERAKIITEMKTNNTVKIQLIVSETDDTEINIDDI